VPVLYSTVFTYFTAYVDVYARPRDYAGQARLPACAGLRQTSQSARFTHIHLPYPTATVFVRLRRATPVKGLTAGEETLLICLPVDFEEGGDVGDPDFFDEADVIGVDIVGIVGGLVLEAHGQSVVEFILGAGFPDPLEILDPGDVGQFQGFGFECFNLHRFLERKEDGVGDIRLGGQGADEPDEAYEKEIFHEGIQAVGESGFNAEAITHRVP
jgi:hypothetical protein